MEKKYWKSPEELNKQVSRSENENLIPEGKNLLDLINEEIAEKPSSRRNFLKFCGFGFATAAIASSCENPVKKAIPYLNKPEDVTPGMASHFASTFFDGSEYNSILVKVRDGRPIKIEGNTLSSVTKGGTTAKVQASVLSLYDGLARLKNPLKEGKEINWQTADAEIVSSLREISEAGGNTVLLTSNIISPSTQKLINEFTAAFPGVRHMVYDPLSVSGIIMANQNAYGQPVVPDYRFDKAEIIVSFSADFLGSWLSPAEYAARYALTRSLTNDEKKLSYHIQFESGLSITGSKADKRVAIKPSEEAALLIQLYKNLIAKDAQQEDSSAKNENETINELANRLWAAKGKSLVVSGSNDPHQQVLVNGINQLLENNGNTIDFGAALLTKQAVDNEMEELVSQMNNGSISGLILWNVNPAYDYYNTNAFESGIKKIKLTVSFSPVEDETMKFVKYILPANHFLESWDDAEAKRGYYSLAQPVISPLFNTRQPQDTLLKWLGKENDYYTYLKNNWINEILKAGEAEWKTTLQKGIFESAQPVITVSMDQQILTTALAALAEIKTSDGLEVLMVQNLTMGNGNHANNPWLMELPDPVSKVCWDNFAAMSAEDALQAGVATGDLIQINNITLPVFIQPGQALKTISVALGYGHTNFGKVANGVGQNAYPLITYKNGTRCFYNTDVKVTKAEGTYKLASTQMHSSMEGRPIVRETVLGAYLENPAAGNELHAEFEKKHVTLYKETEFKGHHWAMAIDLNKCTGCSTCVISCQAENNSPVVGREEMMKNRNMHWMRIDRYYSGDENNPEVVFQPLMCQHCDNAPCENVCPVSATNHSSEGLNQMAYNRCIGTKYCINNCPYKVRRFNWFRYATNQNFDYNLNSDLGRMVLNPDVTVRERGVVEKCTMCIQRIQEKKLLAKTENRPLEDGEIIPACAQACPSSAIVFGDLNDPNSKVSKLFKDSRNYHLLEELHTLPSVGYLTLVRNKEENKA